MDTKTALLDSAEHAARSRGYDGFSYADLATDVGIRKASIHYHFPTKADLALELMQRYYLTLNQWIADTDRRLSRAGDRLSAQINRYRDALSGGNKLCLCVAYSISTEHLSGDLIEELVTYRKASINWLESVFELGKLDQTISGASDPVAEARACLSLLEGAHLAARATKSIRPFNDAVHLLTDRLVTGTANKL